MAKQERSKRLYFNDHVDRPNGEYWNLPQRDLDEQETARLSDEQYANATATPPGLDGPLYQATESKARRERARETPQPDEPVEQAPAPTADKE